MKTTGAALAALVLCTTAACGEQVDDGVTGVDARTLDIRIVDNQRLLVPPPGYPALDNVTVTEWGRGKSKLMRSSDGATAYLEVKDQVPGHVLVYSTILFNYPEHCVEGEDRLPEPGPCRGNGPLDPRDGLIPEALLSADAWAYAIVGANGKATFRVDLTNDTPTWNSPVNGGPGLVNPLGAVIYTHVMDKGALVPEGPLRGAQVNSPYGGCQGPPAFGPLPCEGVALAQHLP